MESIYFYQKAAKFINILIILAIIYIILAILSLLPVFWIIILFAIMAWHESGGYIVWRPKNFWQFVRSSGKSGDKISGRFKLE